MGLLREPLSAVECLMSLDHPALDQLRAFSEGRLEGAEFERVATHVEACDECATAIENLDPVETPAYEPPPKPTSRRIGP